MGFFSGALGQIGEQVRQKTLMDQAIEHEANQNLSKTLFALGEQALSEKPENAPDFFKAAYAIQTTPLGKKPPKWATDVQGMLFKQRQQQYGVQTEMPPAPQHGNMPDVPLDPNNPEAGTLDQSFAQVQQGLVQQAQKAAQQQQIQQAQQALQGQQQQAQAPPPTSGLPSPGFTSVMPAPPGAIPFPTLPGMPGGTSGFAGPVSFPASGIAADKEFALWTPEQRAQAAMASEMAKASGQQQAMLGRELALEGFRMQQRKQLIDEFKKQGFDHFIESLGANGQPTIKPDIGHSIPGIVPGSDLQDEVDPKTGQPLDPEKFYRIREFADGAREYLVQTNVREMRQINDPSGQSYIAAFDRSGKEVPGTRIATINTALLPSTSTATQAGFRTVQQPDGSTVLVPVTTQTQNTRSLVLPGTPGNQLPTQPSQAAPMPSPPGTAPVSVPAAIRPSASVRGPGVVVGGKSLTPDQMIANSQKAEMLNNTIGVIKDLQSSDNQKVLSNLISTGKIAMQIDPQQGFWRSIINKNMTLTPQEQAVARDWQLLTEGVLQMRIPMGGAGFRGPEGFGAIESNKGILGQHPEIIKGVLDGTLREFRSQRNPLVEGGKKYGYKTNPEMEAIGGMPAAPGTAPLVKTKQEYDALPSGTIYLEEDGKRYRKP